MKLRVLPILTLCALAVTANSARAQGIPSLDAAGWQADIDFLADELPRRHASWYSQVKRSEFEAAVTELRSAASGMADYEVLVGMMRLAALGHDEATLVPVFRAPVEFNILPLQVYWFDDGLFVIDAGPDNADLIGERIARIGAYNVDRVFERVKPVMSVENEYHARWWFGVYGLMPEVLAARGVIRAPGRVTLTVVRDGKSREVDVEPVRFGDYAKRFFLSRVGGRASPAQSNFRDHNYWFEYRDSTETLFVQFNQVREEEGQEPLAKFIRRIWATVDSVSVSRVVLDLRNGGGGSGDLLAPVVALFSEHPRINRAGALFTLIGRRTSGTLAEFASMMELRTKTLFVGEPTGEGPNGVGDSDVIQLPNSGVKVFYTKRFWPTSLAEDKRRYISPDIRVGYTYVDYAHRDDPWMTAVREYRHPDDPGAPVTLEVAAQMEGRYQFSSYQVLVIERRDDALWMTIDDHLPGSYVRVSSELRTSSQSHFQTDIDRVTVDAPLMPGEAVDQLFVNWKGHERTVLRAPMFHRLPAEMIADGDVADGVALLLADREGRHHYQAYGWRLLAEGGQSALEAGRDADAELLFDAATQLFPGEPLAWVLLGRAREARGNGEAARAAYQRAADVDPGNLAARQALKRLSSQ